MPRIKQSTPNKPAWAEDAWNMGSIMDEAVNEVIAKGAKNKAEGDEIINQYRLSSGQAFADELRKRVKQRYQNASR